MVFEIIFGERELGIWIILAYLFFFLIARMLLIAIPWHRWIQSQIESKRRDICCVEQSEEESPKDTVDPFDSGNNFSPQPCPNILTQANNLLDKADELIKSDKNLDFFFWSGSHEVDAMLLVYEADRHRVCILSKEELHARIKWAMTEIGVLSKDKQDAWRAVFGNTENKTDKDFDEDFYKKISQNNLDRYRAYLNQLLGDLHDVLIKDLTAQFNLLNKAVWMILIGLLLITGLMLSGYGLILLAGAVGGLLSRLQRVIFTKNLPTDYSVYWVSLFFSPMVGALAAWGGLVIVVMLLQIKILNLQGIGITDLQNPISNSVVLGLAVIFGISERMLDSLTKQAEAKLSPEEEKKETA